MKQLSQKFLSLLLACVLAFGLLPGAAFAEGAAASIASAEEFAVMPPGGNYVLTEDITVSAPYKEPFVGTFDGNGHKITAQISTSTAYTGVFSIIGAGGTVQNLTVCGTISSSLNYVGGIAGKSSGTIQNCVNMATVSGTETAQYIGGIVGSSEANAAGPRVLGCANMGDVSGKEGVGGIAGQGKNANISYCYNAGSVSDLNTSTDSSRIAGLVGITTKGGNLSYCYNRGEVSSVEGSGATPCALVGFLTGMSMDHCYWLTDIANNLSNQGGGTVAACEKKDADEIKGNDFIAMMNANAPVGSRFASDVVPNINGGFPILEWQGAKAEEFSVAFTLTPSYVELTVKNAAGAPQVGANGVYKLPAGAYTYTASAFGFETKAEVPLVVDADATIEVSLEETPRRTVTFTGLPVGAVLSVAHAVGGVMGAEADGSYRLPAGDYTYTAIARGFEPVVNHPFTVNGAAVELAISFAPLASQAPWDGTLKVEPTAVGGVYYVKNGAELAWLAGQMDAAKLLDANITLLCDIDLDGKPWETPGTHNVLFNGHFNGNGCTVKNLAGADSYGLFYGTDKAAIIENLTVTGSITGSSNIGGIVGINNGAIINCAAGVTISATGQRVGGVVGSNNGGGTIEGCAALAPVSSSCALGGNTVNLGGIAGQSSGTIRDSYSVAAVSATGSKHSGNVGGITGDNKGVLENCYSTGTVGYPAADNRDTGAIAGTSTGTLDNTYYLDTSCAAGVGTGSSDGAQAMPDPVMKKYTLPLALNKSAADGPFHLADNAQQNSGYPVLKWQGGKTPEASGDEKAVIADKAALSIAQTIYTKPGTVTLPTTGAQGSAIAWESSHPAIVSAAGVVTLPTAEDKAVVTLTANLTKGDAADSRHFTLTVYSAAQVILEHLNAANAVLSRTPLKPVCPWDNNIVSVAKQRLVDAGFTEVDVALKSNGEGGHIAADGQITYFYETPSGPPVAYQRGLVFALTEEGQSVDSKALQANIPWDRAKVQEIMKSQVASNITWEAIRGGNAAADQVTVALTLPLKLEGAGWATISWKSSSDVVYPETAAPAAADTIGTVIRARMDTPVTLTATIRFNLTSGDEADITLSVPLTLTVLGDGQADTEASIKQKLDQYYTMGKIKDAVSKAPIVPTAVTGDIFFPTPSNTGVPDYSAYRFSVASNSEDVLKVNGYRGYVYRPLPGEEPVKVGFTVTMTSRATPSLSASKSMEVTVKPLTQEEINDAIKLMDAAKADYANALLGSNASAGSVSTDLAPFREVAFEAGSTTKLVYSRNVKDDTGSGVAVDDLPGSEAGGPGYELWRTYRSSRPDLVENEILRVHQPTYATAVTVDSCLTHDVLGKYATLYPDNADFQKLYQVPVSAQLTVKGTTGEVDPEPDRTFSTSFALNGKGYIESIAATSVGGLKAGATAFDVFQKTLAARGFTYEGSGKYISAVIDSKGVRLAEMDVGAASGWLYTVNGAFPSKAPNEYYLVGDERVEFLYTADWKQEPGIPDSGTTRPADTATLKPTATVDKNGEAKAQVTAKELAGAVAAAKKSGSGSIVIQPAIKGDASKVSVALPKAALAGVSQDAAAALVVKTPIADITLPAAALGELGKRVGETVSVSAETVKGDDGKSTGEIRLEIQLDGKTVERMTGGFAVALPVIHPTAGTVLVQMTGEGAKIVRKSAVEGETLNALLSGSATVVVKDNVQTFPDVGEQHWGKDAVSFVAAHELFRGTEAGDFDPAGEMSRAMLFTVLERLEGRDVTAGGTWYESSMLWAKELGISDGTDPEGGITREQLATMLFRYAVALGADTAHGGTAGGAFEDAAQVSAWAGDAVAWAVENDLLRGNDGKLNPTGLATRAEVAAVLQRFVSVLLTA